jgi:hypothetical protein
VQFGENVTLTNYGPKSVISATAGDLNLGTSNSFQNVGGNLVFLSKGNILDEGVGASANTYSAGGIVNGKSGGVEFSAGTTISTIGGAFGKPAGFYGFTAISQIGSPTILPGLPGQSPPVFRGILVLNPASSVANTGVTLSGTLDFTSGGAMVFSDQGGKTVTINGNVITTSSKPLTPVSNNTIQSDDDMIVDTNDYDAGSELVDR